MTNDEFPLGPATMEATFDSRCPMCGGDIAEGEIIHWLDDVALWVCEPCSE